ncbi:MAG: hypothetical protein U0V73_02255 [Acidimicrobiia bacterium]
MGVVVMGVLYAVGAACFVLGSLPPYFEHVDPTATALTFFVGSIFFTTAATFQVRADRVTAPLFSSDAGRVEWWSDALQWVGTLAFNVSTGVAIVQGLTAGEEKRLVWAPDVVGSTFFLASSILAVVVVRIAGSGRRDRGIAGLNLAGSVAFGLAAAAAFVVPTTNEVLNIRWVNAGTAIGGVCFFVASVWMTRPVAERAFPG